MQSIRNCNLHFILGDEKETTICKNKVSLTGPGTWFSAKKVCVHYVTNDVSAKNGRIIQFNGGLMTKDAYKGKFLIKDLWTAGITRAVWSIRSVNP